MSIPSPRDRELTATARHAELVAAVQRGVVGMDADTARHILAALVPVLREQIARDLLAVDPAEWALVGQHAGSHAAYIARGVAS